MRRRPRPPLLLPLLGMLAGGLGAPWWIAHLAPPVALDSSRWTVLVPGRNDGMADANLSNGTGLVDGSLLISQRSFGRADLLMPHDPRPVGELELHLASHSGPIYLNCRNPGGFVTRIGEFSPTQWRTSSNGAWKPYSPPLHVGFHDQQIWVEGVSLAVSDPGTLELTPSGPTAQIQAIRLWDPQKQLWLEEDFSSTAPSLAQRFLVAMAGGLIGALWAALWAGHATSGLIGGFLLLLPALGVFLVPYPEWRALTERLYLVQTAPGILRIFCFLLGLLPLLAGALLASGQLPVEGRARGGLLRWLPLLLLTDLGASRADWRWALPGLLWLLIPLWVGRRAGQPLPKLFQRDLPALLAVAGLGWGPGLLPALLWRILGLVADTPLLLEQNPRAGTDFFLLLMATFPVSVECALRSSYLNEGWDPVHLAGASVGTEAAPFSLFWSAHCWDPPPSNKIYAFGGSSTGGAYQFKDNPGSFFAAQLHEKFCARRQGEIVTYNYGDSGRDSWDVSHAAPALYARNPPRIVLYYGGVNDLLTRDAPLTRKQRAAVLAARSAPVAGLDSLGSSLRTLTGLGLLLRPPETSQALVVAVPLADAEENLRSLAASTAANGGELWLIPEYAEPYVAEQLKPYWAMEARLATELPHVHYYDLYAALAGSPEELLADRNHLSRIGSSTVADLLFPMLEPFLWQEAAHE